MKRPLIVALLGSLVLAGCGAEAPAAATITNSERNRTQVALVEQPTLAPVPTATPAADRPTATPAAQLSDLYALLEVTDDDPRAVGQVDAPVVIIEFTDYE